jgi:uroporphyrinogen decarboxylase
MNHKERLEAVLGGTKPDRVPVALWRHFPVDDQDPGSLAAATIDYQRAFDFDLVKVTPASSFCLKDWGARDEWCGASEGTREYTMRVIQKPGDWERLQVLDPHKGWLGGQIECLRIVTEELGDGTPVIQTIFSPLAQAKNLVGNANLMVHIRQFPDELHSGLTTIAETIVRFIGAAKQVGIAGIFYAVQHAQYHLLSQKEYEEFGRQYDLMILESVRELWLNMLHLHGENVMFDHFQDYPVGILNWHDQDTEPDLREGKKRFPGVVCGGLQRERTMVLGTPDQVVAEAQKAIQVTEGKRFILGTGCVVPIIAPRANLLAARRAVERSG